jgi:glycosyltransferase involved in cell wall biosynthesis
VHVVYNTVPAVPQTDEFLAPDVDLVSVARLVPWKGFDQLISVVAKNGWSLRIVGDGPLRGQLEDRARKVRAKVEFSGHVLQSDVTPIIRRARIFVLNSSYEGLPHIVLEAMAAKVPVVATAVGGTPETIIDGITGLLVPAGDATALEERIALLLAKPALRDAIIENATARLIDRFSFDRMAAETEGVLESVLRDRIRHRVGGRSEAA